jgi:hypothetical protein
VFDGEVEVSKLVADFSQYLVVGPRYILAMFYFNFIY